MPKERKTKLMKHKGTNVLVASFVPGWEKQAQTCCKILNIDMLVEEGGYYQGFFYIDRGTKENRILVEFPGSADLPPNNELVDMVIEEEARAKKDDPEYRDLRPRYKG